MCDALSRAYTADKFWELEDDIERIQQVLPGYRKARGSHDETDHQR